MISGKVLLAGHRKYSFLPSFSVPCLSFSSLPFFLPGRRADALWTGKLHLDTTG